MTNKVCYFLANPEFYVDKESPIISTLQFARSLVDLSYELIIIELTTSKQSIIKRGIDISYGVHSLSRILQSNGIPFRFQNVQSSYSSLLTELLSTDSCQDKVVVTCACWDLTVEQVIINSEMKYKFFHFFLNYLRAFLF
jgi:hypothetical protein